MKIQSLINKKAKPTERKPLITACTRFGNKIRWNIPLMVSFALHLSPPPYLRVKEHIYLQWEGIKAIYM
jgi:hypothetical protein